MNNHVSTSFLVLLSSLGACTDGEPGHDGIDDTFLAGDGKADGSGITDGTPEARAVLRVANGASAATLKADVGLYAPAVTHLIAYRAGTDAVLGTADDRVIATLVQLDAIPYIGPASYQELVDYATTLTWSDWLPVQFSATLTVPTPSTYHTWTSITETDPNPAAGTAKTLQVQLLLTKANGTVTLQDVATQARGAVDANGNFSVSYYNNSVSPDGRSISYESKLVSGEISPLGEVVITGYSDRKHAGNSIYGYNGSTAQLAGDAHVGLAFVEPAAR